MCGIAYFNGCYLPIEEILVSIEDRGYMLGDGIYEVVAIINGTPIDLDDHLMRLKRCLNYIQINFDKKLLELEIKLILQELLERNNGNKNDYKLYLQITRGKAPRNHSFDREGMQHSLLMILYPHSRPRYPSLGLKCILEPDIRWLRKDIKAISLLANVLLKQKAKDNNADEAILYKEKENNIITEGAACNIFMVDHEEQILTHPADSNILHGATRARVIYLAQQNNLVVIERPFTIEELFKAREVFASTSGFLVAPILEVDKKLINNGKIGSMTAFLEKKFHEYIDIQIENKEAIINNSANRNNRSNRKIRDIGNISNIFRNLEDNNIAASMAPLRKNAIKSPFKKTKSLAI